MTTTPRNSRNRFILAGSALALCFVSIHSAHGISLAGEGEGLLIQAPIIQDTFLNSIIRNGTDGGAPGGGGGIGLRVRSGQISSFSLTNSGAGSIMGGLGLTGMSGGGDGVRLSAGDLPGAGSISNVVINSNSGKIAGGTGATDANGGHGIALNARAGIDMVTINNIVTITGGIGGMAAMYSGNGGNGIDLAAGTDVTNVWINNFSLVSGGVGGTGSSDGSGGGTGIRLASNFDPSFITTMNTGSILGGAGGNGVTDTDPGGSGGFAIYFSAGTTIDTVTFINAQNAVIRGGIGGKGLPTGGSGGFGIVLATGNDITNANFDNKGMIAGGDGGQGTYGNSNGVGETAGKGGRGGSAIFLETGNGRKVDGVTITNAVTGEILGGEGGYGTNGGDGGSGGIGVGIDAPSGSVMNVRVTNLSRILGGEGGSTGMASIGRGGTGGDGINFSNSFYPIGTIDGFNIFNGANASLKGGDGGHGDSFGGEGGHGITMTAGDIKNGTITNKGNIGGGNGGASPMGTGGAGGVGIDLEVQNQATLKDITITNAHTGVIKGGNAGMGSTESNANGGEAIFLSGPPSSTNIHVVNFGTVMGGDSCGVSAAPGAGIANTELNQRLRQVQPQLSGLVIDNWGTVAAGAGTNRIAINIAGSGNTLNLNGHSTVDGKINFSGGEDGNVVNLNFTGVDPATLASLRASLLSQGANTGHDTPLAEFTLRGVHYVIDPAVVNIAMTSYQLQGLNADQQSIGANLDSMKLAPTGDMKRLVDAIDNSGNVPGALDAISPQPYQVFGDIAVANATFTTLQIDERLDNRRVGSEGFDTSRFRVGSSAIENQLGLSGPKGRTGHAIKPPAKGTVPVASENRWGGFLSGNAVFADLDGGPLGDASFTSAGLTLGVDYRFTDALVGGLLFGYSNTDADLDARGSTADVDTYTFGVYGGWNKGPWYVNGLATYAHNEYDSSRRIFIPGPVGVDRFAGGSTSGDQFVINVDGGYDYVLNDRVTVGPVVGLQYVHLAVDGFDEAPGVGSLSVGNNDLDSLRSRLGARLNFHKAYRDDLSIAADVRASWQHEFLDDNSISATFSGSGLAPFTVGRRSPSRDSALLGSGLNVTWRQYYTFFFDYDAQVGGDVLHSVKGGFKMTF